MSTNIVKKHISFMLTCSVKIFSNAIIVRKMHQKLKYISASSKLSNHYLQQNDNFESLKHVLLISS